MVPWCVDALHGRFHWREPGSGLRLSQPATPAPALTLGVRHLSCGVSHPCSGRLTGSAGPRSRPRGAAFDLACGLRCACIPPARSRGRAVGLGACHLSCGDSHCACGASHRCSGRCIRPLRRAALRLPAFGAPGPRTARRGTCTHARGASLVLRGDPFALCPCPLAWPSQCIRTIDPFRGALPPVSDLPQLPR